jgi:hypothetical protein
MFNPWHFFKKAKWQAQKPPEEIWVILRDPRPVVLSPTEPGHMSTEVMFKDIDGDEVGSVTIIDSQGDMYPAWLVHPQGGVE